MGDYCRPISGSLLLETSGGRRRVCNLTTHTAFSIIEKGKDKIKVHLLFVYQVTAGERDIELKLEVFSTYVNRFVLRPFYPKK